MELDKRTGFTRVTFDIRVMTEEDLEKCKKQGHNWVRGEPQYHVKLKNSERRVAYGKKFGDFIEIMKSDYSGV